MSEKADLYTGKLVLLEDGTIGPASILVKDGKILEVKPGLDEDPSRYAQVGQKRNRIKKNEYVN